MKNTKKIEFKPLTPIDGNRSEAVNVRRRGDWMEVTGTPAAVCPKTTDDRFLGADRRGSRTYYFLTSSLKKHAFYNLLINNILYLCVT